MSVVRIELLDLSATKRLGALLAKKLMVGDVIALSGKLGAGKSALARAIIQAVDPAEDDVPSPTFTLVQTYALADGTPLWHLDLYRLNGPEEMMALGLDDAFVEAVCLIEWPDRLGNLLPETNLSIHLYADDACSASLDFLDGGFEGSSVRFADITAQLNWADRIKDLMVQVGDKSA
jgi:tRNA threonylcarbamoyladenosine biosynthesis protein TsaE